MEAFHAGEIDQQSIVAQTFAGDVVATAPHRYDQVVLPRKFHAPDGICGAQAASDERWPLVDHPVPNFSRRIIDRVARLNYPTSNVLFELLKSGVREHECASGTK
jgi:hypothetical protein